MLPILSLLLIASVLAVPTPLGERDGWRDGMTFISTDWRTEIVDDAQCGFFTSIALDSEGQPHISYHYDVPGLDLRYARWTGVGWSIGTVDKGANPQDTSIEIDNEGNPHISYFADSGKDLKYARWTGSAWKVETVDSPGWVGQYTSLVLDSSGNPHISYFDNGDNKDLKYAVWTGNHWSIETVDAPGHVGRFTSLALDSSDNAHISYYSNSETALKYAKWNGTAWNIEIVDLGGDVGGWTSIALDSNDRPHISYYDWANGDLKYTEWNGTAWSTKVLDSAGEVGMYTSIAIDSGDNPHISYRLNVHGDLVGDLRYAKRAAGSWSIEAVDYLLNVGGYTSLALDGNNDPHISYYANSYMDLKYATKAELEPGNPSLSYSPSILDFGTLPPETNDTRTFDVWNSGDGTLAFTINESVPWAAVSPLEGWSTGELHTINVTIDTTGLPGGLKEGSIHISSNGGNGTVALVLNASTPSRTVSLDIDPDTLNLKSMGRWITAYLNAENASVHDIDVSTILLQDALAPERWDYQDDVLMLKFNRQELIAMLEVGDSVEIKLTGKWKDGTAFEAYDTIRIINPGK